MKKPAVDSGLIPISSSNNKRQKTSIQDNRVPTAVKQEGQSFNFGELPVELQENILIKAVVTLCLSSKTFGEVYDALAPVCKRWSDLARDRRFQDQIKQQIFLQDPMYRYLQTAQRVPLFGFDHRFRYISCAVALKDVLYVTESLPDADYRFRVFTYDINDTDVRHKRRSKRKITLSNRKPLVINGLIGDAIILVPCPRTDCLYALEYDIDDDDVIDTIVHKIKPDGTVVLRWKPNDLDNSFTAISFYATGTYMAFIYEGLVSMVSTATGASVDAVKAGAGKEMNIEVTIKFDEKTTTTRSEFLPSLTFNNREVQTFDDHGCALRLSQSHMTLTNIRTGEERELRSTTARKFAVGYLWFDSARGLIFCANVTALRVFRVTH